MDRRSALKVATQLSLASASAGLYGGELSRGKDSREALAAQSSRAPSRVDADDGTILFTRAWGEGRPIVFVHAWAMASDAWQYQMVPLSTAGFRCIAYDRRGHGRSADPGMGFDYTTLANDLRAVLEAFDVRDGTLVGHSMAAGELIRYATLHGTARVSRLVLVAPACTPFRMRSPDNPDGVPAERLEQLRQENLLRDLPLTLERTMPAFLLPGSSKGMLDWVIRMVEQTSLKALVECHRSTTETDFRGELRALRMPTLIIHGDRDTSAPVEITGRPTASLVTGSRLVIYEGAPHGLPLTHADRLTTDIRNFASG